MNILRTSCHGNLYSVPENLVPYFIQLDEAVENADYGSDEEQLAMDEFITFFVEYEKSYV